MLLTCRVHLALNKAIVNADRVGWLVRLRFILRNVDQVTQAQNNERQKAKQIAIHCSSWVKRSQLFRHSTIHFLVSLSQITHDS